MQITDTVIASVIGGSIAVITGLLTALVTYRALRAEFLGKHRLDLINKQISACEALWTILESTSRSFGDSRIIVYKHDKPYLVISVAKELYSNLTKVFYTSSGLYYSRPLRDALFDLRDFISEELLALVKDEKSEIEISKTKAKSFIGRVTNLRITLRKEIGTENLKVTNEGPAKGF